LVGLQAGTVLKAIGDRLNSTEGVEDGQYGRSSSGRSLSRLKFGTWHGPSHAGSAGCVTNMSFDHGFRIMDCHPIWHPSTNRVWLDIAQIQMLQIGQSEILSNFGGLLSPSHLRWKHSFGLFHGFHLPVVTNGIQWEPPYTESSHVLGSMTWARALAFSKASVLLGAGALANDTCRAAAEGELKSGIEDSDG